LVFLRKLSTQPVRVCQRVAQLTVLKAAEMLARLCGWNEPEQVKHDHVHLQVDSAALIEQLRAGYAQLALREPH
jgi:hypothetical protein